MRAQTMPQLFRVTETGGDSATGVLYRIGGYPGYLSTIHDFVSSSGCNPKGTLLRAADGNLYGTTTAGGANGKGGIFRFDLSTYTYTNLYSFSPSNGIDPCNKMLQATDGKLYGMTAAGGHHNAGVLFSFDPVNSTFSKLVDLGDNLGEINQIPYSGVDLMEASDGKLYGITPFGGANATGVLFSYDINSNNFQKLYDFGQMWGPDGQYPVGRLTELSQGSLFGVCSQGGSAGWGTIFKFNINQNVYMKLHDLQDALDESGPNGFLKTSNGHVYFTCQTGSLHAGSIFEFDTATNTLTQLYSNFSWTTGAMLNQDMIMASDSLLYGITMGGGSWGNGTIFSFNPTTKQYTTLSVFPCAHISGQAPKGGIVEVIQNANGIDANDRPTLQIHPNPVSDHLDIELTKGIDWVRITNVQGVEVLFVKPTLSSDKITVNVSGLAEGYYNLILSGQKFRQVGKLVVQH